MFYNSIQFKSFIHSFIHSFILPSTIKKKNTHTHIYNTLYQIYSTWIFENQVSIHLVISLNLACLILFTALFAYV